MARAKDLLTHSNESLRTIATACGFSNEHYFNTAFRRYAALTPNSFRDQARRRPV